MYFSELLGSQSLTLHYPQGLHPYPHWGPSTDPQMG